MKRKLTALIAAGLMTVGMIGTAVADALPSITSTPQMMMGMSFDHTFGAHESYEIENMPFFSSTASCTVSTKGFVIPVYAVMKSRGGSVNGQHLSSGQDITIQVSDGDHFSMKAEPSAKVHMENKSTNVLHVSCRVDIG